MNVYCENRFCIYYENNQCRLDSVSLDELGICEQIFFVDIGERILSIQRKKLLKKLKQQNNY